MKFVHQAATRLADIADVERRMAHGEWRKTDGEWWMAEGGRRGAAWLSWKCARSKSHPFVVAAVLLAQKAQKKAHSVWM